MLVNLAASSPYSTSANPLAQSRPGPLSIHLPADYILVQDVNQTSFLLQPQLISSPFVAARRGRVCAPCATATVFVLDQCILTASTPHEQVRRIGHS